MIVGAAAYALLVTGFCKYWELPAWSAGNEVAGALGVALGVLVAFRNNAAYDRWWEARKQWGQLINDSRNLALKARAHADVPASERRELSRLLIGFCHALRLHLRGVAGVRNIPGFGNEPIDFPHAPGYVAGQVHALLGRWNRTDKLHETIIILDAHARSLLDVCGACERIRNTPLASSYRAMDTRSMARLFSVTAMPG